MVTRFRFTASLLKGAHIVRSVWPSLPRHGEESAWESAEAAADYCAKYDEGKRGPGPWVPPEHSGPDAAITPTSGERTITAHPLPDQPWIYRWEVDMTQRPSVCAARLLADLLLHNDVSYSVEFEQ